ncbi:hypothetical protein LCGC14_0956870 [marine sediment metagenome]|uniref:Uncharacterized protein n=1 Tax=marine sediment metagenome TaxID=412755 RepID=A0A0F9P1V0_9ZZZZ
MFEMLFKRPETKRVAVIDQIRGLTVQRNMLLRKLESLIKVTESNLVIRNENADRVLAEARQIVEDVKKEWM